MQKCISSLPCIIKVENLLWGEVAFEVDSGQKDSSFGEGRPEKKYGTTTTSMN